MLAGCDLHAGYGKVDHAAMKAGGIRFVWAKCTTGNQAGVDAQFVNNLVGCQAQGIPIGAYHFAFPLPEDPKHPGRSPKDQVDRAYAGCGGLGSNPGELPPVVDAEWPAPEDAGPKWGLTRPQISAWLKEYCELATAKWGRPPIVYSYPSWWRWLSQGADVSWASEYLLWFADYGWPGPGTPPDGWVAPHLWWVSSTWKNWTICQYSAEGSSQRVPGVNACPVDRDCITSEEDLTNLLAP